MEGRPRNVNEYEQNDKIPEKKLEFFLGYYESNDIIKLITYQTFGDRISTGFNKHTKKVKFTLKK